MKTIKAMFKCVIFFQLFFLPHFSMHSQVHQDLNRFSIPEILASNNVTVLNQQGEEETDLASNFKEGHVKLKFNNLKSTLSIERSTSLFIGVEEVRFRLSLFQEKVERAENPAVTLNIKLSSDSESQKANTAALKKAVDEVFKNPNTNDTTFVLSTHHETISNLKQRIFSMLSSFTKLIFPQSAHAYANALLPFFNAALLDKALKVVVAIVTSAMISIGLSQENDLFSLPSFDAPTDSDSNELFSSLPPVAGQLISTTVDTVQTTDENCKEEWIERTAREFGVSIKNDGTILVIYQEKSKETIASFLPCQYGTITTELNSIEAIKDILNKKQNYTSLYNLNRLFDVDDSTITITKDPQRLKMFILSSEHYFYLICYRSEANCRTSDVKQIGYDAS